MVKAIAGRVAATRTARAQTRDRPGGAQQAEEGQSPVEVGEGAGEEAAQGAAVELAQQRLRAAGGEGEPAAQGLPGVLVVAPGEGQTQQGGGVALPEQEQGDGDGRGGQQQARAGAAAGQAVEPVVEQGREVDEVDQAGRPGGPAQLGPGGGRRAGLPDGEGLGEHEQEHERAEGHGVGLGGRAHEDEAAAGGDEEGADPGHQGARPVPPAEPPDAERRAPPGEQIQGGEAPVRPQRALQQGDEVGVPRPAVVLARAGRPLVEEGAQHGQQEEAVALGGDAVEQGGVAVGGRPGLDAALRAAAGQEAVARPGVAEQLGQADREQQGGPGAEHARRRQRTGHVPGRRRRLPADGPQDGPRRPERGQGEDEEEDPEGEEQVGLVAPGLDPLHRPGQQQAEGAPGGGDRGGRERRAGARPGRAGRRGLVVSAVPGGR